MALRVTQHHIEFGGDPEVSDLRLTEQYVQVGISGADYSTKVRLTEQFVQVGVVWDDNVTEVRMTEQCVQVCLHNEGRAKTAVLGDISAVMAGDTVILGHPSGTLDLSYYPSPTSQPGRPDSVTGLTMMVGAPVNQPATIPTDFTGQLGVYRSVFGATLIWGYGANSGAGAIQLTGQLGTINSVLGGAMIPAYPSNATAGGPSVFNKSAQSLLSVSQDVGLIQDVSADASNSFSLTQAATSSIKMAYGTSTIVLGVVTDQNIRKASALSALSITQSARQNIFELSAASNINISGTWDQDADPGLFEQSLSQSLTLTQEARTTLKSASAVSTLALTHETESNSQLRPVVSTLTLTQEATWSGPLPVQNPESDLGATLDHDVTVDVSAYGRRAGNVMGLQQDAHSSIQNVSAYSVLTLTDRPRLADTYEKSIAHTLNLTHSVGISGSLRYFAASTLTLEGTVDNNVKTRHPSSLIALTQTAEVSFVKTAESILSMSVTAEQGFVNLFAESHIELDHIGRPNPRERDGFSTLVLTDAATSSIRMLDVESTLELDQNLNVQRPFYAEAESEIQGSVTIWNPDTGQVETTYFGLDHEATHQLATAHRYARNIISLSQTARPVLILSTGTDVAAESTLSLTDEANLSQSVSAVSVLEMEVTADAVVGIEAKTVWEPPVSTFEVYDPETDTTQTVEVVGQWADFTIDRAQAAQSVLYVKQAAAYILQADTTKCYYTPFVGNSSDPNAPTPPATSLPAQSYDPSVTRFKLVVPTFGEIDAGATLADSITLRAPEFGNQEGVAQTRVSVESTGRTLLVFRDPEWPKSYTMSLTWNALTKEVALQLMRFISDNLGLEIGIQDHEGRCWKGTIVNPDEAVTEDHNDNFSASIRFEDVQRDTV